MYRIFAAISFYCTVDLQKVSTIVRKWLLNLPACVCACLPVCVRVCLKCNPQVTFTVKCMEAVDIICLNLQSVSGARVRELLSDPRVLF